MRVVIARLAVAIALFFVRDSSADPKKPSPKKADMQPFFCSYIDGSAKGGSGEQVFNAACFDWGDPKNEACGPTTKACDWLHDKVADGERKTSCEMRHR